MSYRVILYDTEGNEYRGTTLYDTYEEAEEVLEGSDEPSYIDGHEVAGGHIEEE